LPGELERIVGDIVNPKIDWRKKLYQFITKDLPVDFTMKRPGKRFYSTGVYLPSVIRENIQVLIGIDVSGSIGSEEYNDFISEIVGIAKGFAQIKMRVIYWSTTVNEKDDVEVYGTGIDEIINHKVHESGGTDMSCFKKYCVSKNYNSPLVIMFTDGFIESNPDVLPCKHLFVLSKNHSVEIVSKYGDVCTLNDTERNFGE
jgi:predicted metal-dependent peptidase